MSRVGLQVAAVAALIAVLLLAPGGARAADDATAALLQMMDGDISLLGDDSLSSLFLSLADMSTNPQVMQTVQAVRTSVGSPAASSEPAASSGPAATGTTGASSEAALVGDLFDALFTGADSPLSTFLAAADGGGVSSQLAALLGPISSGAAARSTSAASAPMLRTSLGSLLGGATGTAAGTSAGSSPLSALLQPVASTRSVLDQLAQAVQAADSVLNLPHYDDLFGGIDLARFFNGNRTMLKEVVLAIEDMQERMCTPSHVQWSEEVPTTCNAHNITLAIDGGECVINPRNHSVTCRPPRVLLIKTPATCTKRHTKAMRVAGDECKIDMKFGEIKQGYLKHPHHKNVTIDFSDANAPRLVRSSPSSTTSRSSSHGGLQLAGRVADALKRWLPRRTTH